jgi:hypothetical protein
VSDGEGDCAIVRSYDAEYIELSASIFSDPFTGRRRLHALTCARLVGTRTVDNRRRKGRDDDIIVGMFTLMLQ